MESSTHRYKYIVFIRHGERSDWASRSKCKTVEPQLTAKGVSQVNRAAQYNLVVLNFFC